MENLYYLVKVDYNNRQIDNYFYFTDYENYNSRIQDARKIVKFDYTFTSLQAIVDYIKKYFNVDLDNIIYIDKENHIKKFITDLHCISTD